MREQFVKSEDLIGEQVRHFEIEARHTQAICDYVVGKIRQDGDNEERISVSYAGGFTASIPKFCLDMDGHALEKRLQTAFTALKSYGDGLKATVIGRALADMPDCAPQDVIELFRRLSS